MKMQISAKRCPLYRHIIINLIGYRTKKKKDVDMVAVVLEGVKDEFH
jgi:hypothetical protein